MADDEFMGEFLEYCKTEKMDIDSGQVEKSSPVLGLQLKALIARNLYNGEAYYYVFNKEMNHSFLKAVEAIENNWFKKYNVTWTKK